MFGISGEHILIFGIILLIFGPKRLPELGNTLGKAIKNFKDSVSGIEEAKFRKLADQTDAVQATPVAPGMTTAPVTAESTHAAPASTAAPQA